ncbi:hypothetical protein ACFLY7_00105 [Patescibacteria group bacterium]
MYFTFHHLRDYILNPLDRDGNILSGERTDPSEERVVLFDRFMFRTLILETKDNAVAIPNVTSIDLSKNTQIVKLLSLEEKLIWPDLNKFLTWLDLTLTRQLQFGEDNNKIFLENGKSNLAIIRTKGELVVITMYKPHGVGGKRWDINGSIFIKEKPASKETRVLFPYS